jgi:DNA-binding NtrC family response regulator
LRKKSLPNYFLGNNGFAEEFDDTVVPHSLEETEKEQICKALKFTGNNKTKAAVILGISRVNLIAKIKKYQIEGSTEE